MLKNWSTQFPTKMTLNFEALNKVDLSQRDLVFGYFRRYESMLNKDKENDLLYTIPDLIIYIALSYFYIFQILLFPVLPFEGIHSLLKHQLFPTYQNPPQ